MRFAKTVHYITILICLVCIGCKKEKVFVDTKNNPCKDGLMKELTITTNAPYPVYGSNFFLYTSFEGNSTSGNEICWELPDGSKYQSPTLGLLNFSKKHEGVYYVYSYNNACRTEKKAFEVRVPRISAPCTLPANSLSYDTQTNKALTITSQSTIGSRYRILARDNSVNGFEVEITLSNTGLAEGIYSLVPAVGFLPDTGKYARLVMAQAQSSSTKHSNYDKSSLYIISGKNTGEYDLYLCNIPCKTSASGVSKSLNMMLTAK